MKNYERKFALKELKVPVNAFDRYKNNRGDEVTIYSTEAGGDHPVHGAYLDDGDEWIPQQWTALGIPKCGKYGEGLVLAPVKFKLHRVANVYRQGTYMKVFNTREQADVDDVKGGPGKGARIACVDFVVEGMEGDGLDPDDNVRMLSAIQQAFDQTNRPIFDS
jgi:hypothetical protein